MSVERELASHGCGWSCHSKTNNYRIRSVSSVIIYRRFPIFTSWPNICSRRWLCRWLELRAQSGVLIQISGILIFFPPFSPDSSRYEAAAAFVFTTNGVPSSIVDRITSTSSIFSQSFTSNLAPVVTDSDGLATVVIVAMRSPPGPRTLQFFCGNSAGNATVSLNLFITSVVASILPLSPTPSATPQAIGAPFSVQPSFKLCQASSLFGQCLPAPGQVVIAVAESFLSDRSLDGNKMAQLTGFVSAKSDPTGVATFTNLGVVGSSSQRVYLSFYASGKAWSTWDGSPCFPGSASRCLSYVQLSGGPSIQSLTISGTPSVVKEGTVFPSIIVQAISASNAPIPDMVMYAQFSRIADAAAPKFTTPLKFGKKLLRAVAVTNQKGQAQFNLNTSIGGFAGVYDITFLPSVTSSLPSNINLPVISVLIATSVASVSFQGPSMVVRTLLKTNSASTFGYPIATTAADMQSTDYATFFRLYFNQALQTTRSPQFVVTATDVGSNFVPEKLVEMVSDPPNVLDLFADFQPTFGNLEPSFLPVILSATGSSVLYLKAANPIPLAMWPQPPIQLYGINTARFYFVIDGVKSSSFVTVFLTPPVPPPPMPPSIVFANIGAIVAVLQLDAVVVLSSLCNVTSGLDIFRPGSPPFNAASCEPSSIITVQGYQFCVPNCPSSFPQLLPLWYQFVLPRFYFVVLPMPANPLSRVSSRAAVGTAAPFSLQYGLTTFDGSPLPSSRLATVGAYFKRYRASPIANSQSLKVVDLTSPTNGLALLPNNVYRTTASPFTLISNVTSWLAENAATLQLVDENPSCVGLVGRNFSIAPAFFIQSNAVFPVHNLCICLMSFADFSYSAGASGSVFVDVGLEVPQTLQSFCLS